MSFSEDNNPTNDPKYVQLLEDLEGYRKELFAIGDKLADNPVKAGEYQGKIRLAVSELITYKNNFIDLQATKLEGYARERTRIYKEKLIGSTPSAAEKHASEVTRELQAESQIAKMRVDQIDGEYQKYSNIAIYLASRAKEFNSERMLG